ncbi:hypothetical protein GCK32_007048 [Trichostrongylus colubriformis]|uniref:Uncharacterized protein n=1 Tax=Trichostrongylus colubriformis TaxID=6319 RepID=A0AAN8F0J0_TRICO
MELLCVNVIGRHSRRRRQFTMKNSMGRTGSSQSSQRSAHKIFQHCIVSEHHNGHIIAAQKIGMNSVEKWRAAFREIYGRTPTKNDYRLAPQHVKEECCPLSPCSVEEPAPTRKSGVRLKRPNLDAEENSPVKRRPVKARRLCGDSGGFRTSPRKKLNSSTSLVISPVKSISSPSCGGSKGVNGSTPLKEVQSTSGAFPHSTSEQKSPVKRLLANPAFSSLFDTPEKGLYVFQVAFLRTTPGGVKPKKEKGNYVKINMRKKSYSKGKVSAEQKRKMRRKQNWKKRTAGGGGR